MQLLAKADVVLALGTRLGPFGTLPQHGIDYWPKDAKLIQVEVNPRRIGLVKQAAVGVCGEARAATVDLTERLVRCAEFTCGFAVDDYTRWRLLEGLDDIGLTLRHVDTITEFEAGRAAWYPRTLV